MTLIPDQLQTSHPDRSRRSKERRRLSLATFIMGIRIGNRRDARRTSDQLGYYVDRFESQLLYIALGIMLLSATDAVFTLRLLQMGATEVNPFMDVLIDIDQGLFAIVKLFITAFGVIVLVIHVKFRLFRVLNTGIFLYGIFPAYLILVIYELTLLATHS